MIIEHSMLNLYFVNVIGNYREKFEYNSNVIMLEKIKYNGFLCNLCFADMQEKYQLEEILHVYDIYIKPYFYKIRKIEDNSSHIIFYDIPDDILMYLKLKGFLL